VSKTDTSYKLEHIFRRQRQFKERVGGVTLGDTAEIEEIERRVQQWAEAIMMESAELKDWTPWKHWSKQLGNKRTDVERGSSRHLAEMQLEVADLLCFLINCAIDLGMDAEMLDTMHYHKTCVNHARQDSGIY
jgi:hypothetical protein